MTSGEDEVAEIHSATIPRVDAVDGPAHGLPFMLLKASQPNRRSAVMPTKPAQSIVKSDTVEKYDALKKSLRPNDAKDLDAAVARSALGFVLSTGISSQDAVKIAKGIAVRSAEQGR